MTIQLGNTQFTSKLPELVVIGSMQQHVWA